MSDSRCDPAQLLQEVVALPTDAARARLTAGGAVSERMGELVAEARRRIMRDLPGALTATARLVALADDLGDPRDRAVARRARAQALAYGNSFDHALTLLAEASALAEEAGDAVEAARARMAMLHPLARLGRHEDAIAAGAAARSTFERAGELELAAKADANLGETHRLQNEPEHALACFDRARTVLAADPVAAAQIDSNRAQALLDLNRFGDAQAAFEQAKDAFERAGLTRGAAIVEGNLGDLMSRRGRITAALEHFERARRIFEHGDAPGDLARLETEHAEVLAAAGALEDAAAAYARGLAALTEHRLSAEVARAGLSYGRVLTRLGRYDQARDVLAAAERTFIQNDHTIGRGRALLALGELDRAEDRLDAATTHLEEAWRHLAPRPADAAVAAHALADVLVARGEASAAVAPLEDALAVSDSFDLAPLRADALLTRARLHETAGNAAAALDDLREAVQAIDRLRGSLPAEQLRVSLLGDRSSAYERLADALIRDGGESALTEAFATIERAKSRALLDRVAGGADLADVDPGAAADPAEVGLVRAIATAHGELNAMYARLPERGADVARWKDTLQEVESRIRELERRLDATSGLGGLFATPIELAEVQPLLQDRTALVEYFVVGETLQAIVVRAGGVSAVTNLGSVPDLLEGIERFSLQLGHAMAFPDAADDPVLVSAANRELRRLHELILEPLTPRLADAERIVFIPHGPLHAVPFLALHDGSTALIDRCEAVTAPSASVLRHLGIPRRDGHALVVGVADTDAPEIADEVASIAAALPDTRTLAGPDATWDNVRHATTSARLVHLACHARFASASPLASALQLADGWITTRDLYGLDLGGAAVVLSGCDTGRAAVDRGDELIGLVRGLIAAGASTLLLSLWPVHDAVSRKIMAETYRLWHKDMGKKGLGRLSSSLRQALLACRREHPHPLYWAPFFVIGPP
ncbi:MAG: CHAT domain-containing protein [Phycisphaerae bacterium]|nr:CHAT domain-containing protein [Phycisphaerae bacterium]